MTGDIIMRLPIYSFGIVVMGSFGLVKSYTMPRPVESASLFPSRGKFIAGGDDMWVRLFDFETGDEIGEYFRSHIK